MHIVVNKGSGQILHWQLVFQRCIGCEPEGRWCRLGCWWVLADVEQIGHCLHSGCRVHVHCHSSCIWYCRPHRLGHHFLVVGSTLILEKSHLLSRWHFVELMEWLSDKKKMCYLKLLCLLLTSIFTVEKRPCTLRWIMNNNHVHM